MERGLILAKKHGLQKYGSVANNTWTGMIFVISEMTFISLIFYAIPKSWLINITSSVIFDVEYDIYNYF